jgi:hypothetical protein
MGFPKAISNIETNNNLVLDNNYITENEVIKHEYFGTDKVINDLKQITGFDKGYIELNIDNFIRDHTTSKIIKICTKHFLK